MSGVTMAVYNQGRHRRLAEHVVDAIIGFMAGGILLVVLWLLWLIITLPR